MLASHWLPARDLFVVVNFSLPWEFYFAVSLWLYGQEPLLYKFLPSAFPEYTKH